MRATQTGQRLLAWSESCLGRLLILVTAIGATGCAHLRQATPTGEPMPAALLIPTAASRELAVRLRGLSPSVHPEEAQQLAAAAYTCSRRLAREYRVLGSPRFHNFMVNLGIRQRGLCYQWAEDLMAHLESLHVRTLQLHWAVAHGGTLREHNGVVVTARGQPFEEGILLDAWRQSGRLVWKPVRSDDFPWMEGEMPALR